MVMIQVDLSQKANKNLEGYCYINDVPIKSVALNKILEELSLKEDIESWLKEQDKED